MWDFSIGRAFGMLLKTMPYLIFRVMVYSGIALGYVLLSGIGAGIGYGIGGLGGPDGHASGALVGGLIGFGVGSGIMFFLREYLLYVVKAGHIAVLVELLDGKPLPDGKGQVAYGASVVKQRFVQSSVLFALDRLLKSVIRMMTRVVEGVANFLPIPGTQTIVGLIRGMLKLSVGFLDELILAHAIRTRSDNPRRSRPAIAKADRGVAKEKEKGTEGIKVRLNSLRPLFESFFDKPSASTAGSRCCRTACPPAVSAIARVAVRTHHR